MQITVQHQPIAAENGSMDLLGCKAGKRDSYSKMRKKMLGRIQRDLFETFELDLEEETDECSKADVVQIDFNGVLPTNMSPTMLECIDFDDFSVDSIVLTKRRRGEPEDEERNRGNGVELEEKLIAGDDVKQNDISSRTKLSPKRLRRMSIAASCA